MSTNILTPRLNPLDTMIEQAVSGASGSFDIGDLRIQWGTFGQVSAGASVVTLTSAYASTAYRVFLQPQNQTGWTSACAATTTTTFTSTTGTAGTPQVSYLTIGVKP